MKKALFLILLSALTLLSHGVVRDKFIYKLSGNVFTKSDLYSYYQTAREFKCLYPDSLVLQVFSKQLSTKNESRFEQKGSFTDSDKAFFNDFMSLSKILIYIKNFNVTVDKSLLSYFKLSSKTKRCNRKLFYDEEGFLKAKFDEILKLEVFLRNRFLPLEKNRSITKSDYLKAKKSAKNLLVSIRDQISHEVYW